MKISKKSLAKVNVLTLGLMFLMSQAVPAVSADPKGSPTPPAPTKTPAPPATKPAGTPDANSSWTAPIPNPNAAPGPPLSEASKKKGTALEEKIAEEAAAAAALKNLELKTILVPPGTGIGIIKIKMAPPAAPPGADTKSATDRKKVTLPDGGVVYVPGRSTATEKIDENGSWKVTIHQPPWNVNGGFLRPGGVTLHPGDIIIRGGPGQITTIAVDSIKVQGIDIEK